MKKILIPILFGLIVVAFANTAGFAQRLPKDNFITVNFEYDKSNLTADSRSSLKDNADYLLKNPKLDIVVEGHCDERGTTQYNMALGQRRAMEVKEFYVKQGINSNRIATISYGSQKPLDPRSNEAAWAKNRRTETKVVIKN